IEAHWFPPVVCRGLWLDRAARHQCRSVLAPRPSSANAPVARRSAGVRSAHQLHGGFDIPPGFRLLAVALLFQSRSFLRSLGDGLVAVRLQQLPGVVLDFGFLHSHGVISCSACDGTTPIARERLTSTPIKICNVYLSTPGRPESAPRRRSRGAG